MKLPWKLIIILACVLAIVAGVFGLGVEYGEGKANEKWQQRWDDREEEIQQERSKAYEQAKLNAETARKAIEEEQKNGKKELDRKDKLIASSRDESVRLRGIVKQYEERLLRASGDPTLAALATGGTSVTEASILLAGLYNICIGERQELAGAFERSLTRGLTCEASYNKVRDVTLP